MRDTRWYESEVVAMKKINKMFGEILFALIYSSYKSGNFRSGKGYLWRSNQAISLPFSFAVTLVFALVSGFEFANIQLAGIFGISALTFYQLIELKINRRNLFRYRYIYPKSNKIVNYYLLFVGLFISTLFALFLILKPKGLPRKVDKQEMACHSTLLNRFTY
jgi:hypothetical protein